MTDGEKKARRNKKAAAQEQGYVKDCKDPAYRTASSKPVDCFVFRMKGIVEVVDCKFTEQEDFVISYLDIEKGLREVDRLESRGHKARFVVDMWFPKKKLRRKIKFTEADLGYSRKVWIVNRRMMTKNVSRGGN